MKIARLIDKINNLSLENQLFILRKKFNKLLEKREILVSASLYNYEREKKCTGKPYTDARRLRAKIEKKIERITIDIDNLFFNMEIIEAQIAWTHGYDWQDYHYNRGE